ncbi:Transposon Ty3-G Gag-Pol polyprotein [Gossypium australe]|uniref:Transposon Ty3-G Gag-Pol polyprotein n=1 Tax=Gossypium australe TaxID=47621 RepID=A0A5B6W769_9ROSI|nr:Transposon Ty3-G Gag-Pol polyprotein [Gossypium australe]
MLRNPIPTLNTSEGCYKIGNKGRDTYSNTYNLGWRDHPNFKWGGNQGGGNETQNRPNLPYQPPPLQQRFVGNDHYIYDQQFDRLEWDMQTIKMNI